MDWGRLVTAMITPFGTDGEISEQALKEVVDRLINTGTTAIVACGTTGESPTLSHDEKLHVFESTLKYADGRVPVIAGTGGNDTAEAIRLSKEAESLGVDGLLLVAPYYNRPTQAGLYAHFEAIAKSVSIPIMLYNIPGRSAVNIDTETILKLSQIPNITAVKEASGNMTQILRIAAEKSDDFFLYSGDDKLAIPMMAVGAYGIVSVAAHVVGSEMKTMIDAFVGGDVKLAAQWSGRLLPMYEVLFKASSPAPLKEALKQMGLSAGEVRLPLVAVDADLQSELAKELTRLGKL
jgi:4-hydroxy-tetrahydrodipicolinate synthase